MAEQRIYKRGQIVKVDPSRLNGDKKLDELRDLLDVPLEVHQFFTKNPRDPAAKQEIAVRRVGSSARGKWFSSDLFLPADQNRRA